MKKVLFGILLIILLILTTGYFYIPQFAFQKITDYEPFTFERVLGDTSWVNEYQLNGFEKPEDFGFTNVEEVSFNSALDDLKLSAWYLPSSKETDSTIFLIHGRTSNRLKTLKYLEIIKKSGLDTLYNVFIADMRNSGKSETALTYMGYKFAEDIAGGLEYLANQKSQNHFILYGFSMGAMATYTFLDRKELEATKYDIQKIIVDSPLSDVTSVLRAGSDKLGLPEFIYESTYAEFDNSINGYADRLKMGTLLQNINIPILLIQSNHDQTTPAEHTKEQLKQLTDKNISTWFVDSALHVKVYTNPKYRDTYESKVINFIRSQKNAD